MKKLLWLALFLGGFTVYYIVVRILGAALDLPWPWWGGMAAGAVWGLIFPTFPRLPFEGRQ